MLSEMFSVFSSVGGASSKELDIISPPGFLFPLYSNLWARPGSGDSRTLEQMGEPPHSGGAFLERIFLM